MHSTATPDTRPLPVIDAGEDAARQTLARLRLALLTWEANLTANAAWMDTHDAPEAAAITRAKLDVVRDALDVVGR